jgi:hypothetical protein
MASLMAVVRSVSSLSNALIDEMILGLGMCLRHDVSDFRNSVQSVPLKLNLGRSSEGVTVVSTFIIIGKWSVLTGCILGSALQYISKLIREPEMKTLSGHVRFCVLSARRVGMYFGSAISMLYTDIMSRISWVRSRLAVLKRWWLRSSSQKGWCRLKSPSHII